MDEAKEVLKSLREVKADLEITQSVARRLQEQSQRRQGLQTKLEAILDKFAVDGKGNSKEIEKTKEIGVTTYTLLNDSFKFHLKTINGYLKSVRDEIGLDQITECYDNIDRVCGEMEELFARVEFEIVSQNITGQKEKLGDKIGELLKNNATAQTMLETIFKSNFNISLTLEKMAKNIQDCKTVEERQQIINRATHITKVTESAIMAFEVFEKLKGNGIKAIAVEWLDDIRKVLKDVNLETATLEELQEKSIEIHAIYEKMKVLQPQSKTSPSPVPGPKPEKKLDRARFDGEILIRNALRDILSNKDSEQTRQLLATIEAETGLSGEKLKEKIADLYGELEKNIAQLLNTKPRKSSKQFEIFEATAKVVGVNLPGSKVEKTSD